jgi:spindle assembly abnormal protein 6
MRAELQDPVDLRTLFWRTAPITFRRSERDESFAELNVRVLAGYSSGSEALKVRSHRSNGSTYFFISQAFVFNLFSLHNLLQLVRIYISNDADLSFLYSLDILEQQYGRVREEEQLLVDFGGFAEKVAWLLTQCCGENGVITQGPVETSHAQPPPPPQQTLSGKFRAILNIAGSGAGLLRLVESNTFKDLSHLSLQLRAGTDSSIRQFLAFRLAEVKLDCGRLSASLHEMHAARSTLEAELKSCQRAAADISQESQTRLHQANTEIAGLESRLNTAESSISALKEQLASVHAQHATARDKASTAEAQVFQLQNTKSELEVELSERLSQLQEATARAEAAEASAAQVAQRCQGFEAALQQAEIRINEWKEVASGHENRAAAGAEEAAALRERCAAAAQDNLMLQKQLQEKIKFATEAENKVATLQENLNLSDKKVADMKEKLEAVQLSAGDVQTAAAKAATELEEARTKIESNDKVIAWLNKQLTAAQLQASTVAKPRSVHPSPAFVNVKNTGSSVSMNPLQTTAAAAKPLPNGLLKHNSNNNSQLVFSMPAPPLGNNNTAAPMPLTPEHSLSNADWPKPRPPLSTPPPPPATKITK